MEEDNVNPYLNNRYDVLARHRGTSNLSSFFSKPIPHKPQPTDEDYRFGIMERFI